MYAKKGVTIIGVHTPETAGERGIEAVREKAKQNNLLFPIALDEDGKNWQAWSNRYWPCVYLIDRQGYVRYRWECELNYRGGRGEAIMRQKINELLAEKE